MGRAVTEPARRVRAATVAESVKCMLASTEEIGRSWRERVVELKKGVTDVRQARN